MWTKVASIGLPILFTFLAFQNMWAYSKGICLKGFRGIGQNCGNELLLGAFVFLLVGIVITYIVIRKRKKK